MTILTAAAIVLRVKRLIPNRWFSWVAPNRDAVLGGLSDLALWSNNLVSYARAQSRLASAYGVWLDVWSFDFLQRFILRGSTKDDAFRAFIQATILQERVTRAGMISVITKLTTITPWVFEPWNTYDTGAYNRTQCRFALSASAAAAVSVATDNYIVNGKIIKQSGVAVSVAGLLAQGWTMIAAVLVSPGSSFYYLLWQNNGITPGQYYSVWTVDSNGNYITFALGVQLGDPIIPMGFRTTQVVKAPNSASFGYGVGQGGYGNMNLPGQAFIQLNRGAPSGIPGVGGYAPSAGNTIAGWGVGAMEYAGSWLAQTGITNALIYRLINITKPTGTIMWTAIGAPTRGIPKRPAIFNAKNDTQNLAVI